MTPETLKTQVEAKLQEAASELRGIRLRLLKANPLAKSQTLSVVIFQSDGELLPAIVLLSGQPEEDQAALHSVCLQHKAIGYVLVYRGEIKHPLPRCPQRAIMTVESTRWDYFKWKAIPYDFDTRQHNLVIEEEREMEPNEFFRKSYQSILVDPSLN